MILKFKNKHILAIDKLIKEADARNGIIERIELDPKEAYGLLLEVSSLGKNYVSAIKIRDVDDVDVTHQKLIWGGAGLDKNEYIKTIIQTWYKTQFTVTYKDIPMRIIKPMSVLKDETSPWMEDGAPRPPPTPTPPPPRSVTGKKMPEKPKGPPALPPVHPARTITGKKMPEKPKGPPNRTLQDGNMLEVCDKCGSSWKTKFFFFRGDGCLQSECENYWDKD